MTNFRFVFILLTFLISNLAVGGHLDIDYVDENFNDLKTMRVLDEVKIATSKLSSIPSNIQNKIRILRFGALNEKYDVSLSMFIFNNLFLIKSLFKIEFEDTVKDIEPLATHLQMLLKDQFQIETVFSASAGSRPCLNFISNPETNSKKLKDFLVSGRNNLGAARYLLQKRLEYRMQELKLDE